MRSSAREISNVQYAALPWRDTGAGLEILLITSLRTKRWIIPKGWSVPGLQPHETAALEALEEAGVSGEMVPQSLGSFCYNKRRKAGVDVRCKVSVFSLQVTRQRRQWSEKRKREARWYSTDEALSHVRNAGLRRLIARFAQAIRNPGASCRTPPDARAKKLAGPVEIEG
jgi:8-oxo-dGTP pyrophosphatase MutT (NUDIX family)